MSSAASLAATSTGTTGRTGRILGAGFQIGGDDETNRFVPTGDPAMVGLQFMIVVVIVGIVVVMPARANRTEQVVIIVVVVIVRCAKSVVAGAHVRFIVIVFMIFFTVHARA